MEDQIFDVAPLKFHDKHLGEAIYVYPDTKHPFAGWICRKTKGGEWISVRKATDDDIEKLSQAVIFAHHEG